MSSGRAVALFLLGLFLAFVAFPAALVASAALGYLLAIVALAVGIYMAVKRGGRTLLLVLGVVLAIFSFIILAGIAALHLTAYTLSKVIEEIRKEGGTVTVITTTATTTTSRTTEETEKSKTTKSSTANVGIVEASLGQTVVAGDWRVTAEDVVETKYIKSGESYYGAPEGMKIILVKMKIENAGSEIKRPTSDLSTPVLVTSAGKSYEIEYPISLKWIFQPTKEVIEGAVVYMGLDLSSNVAPGAHTDGHLMYLIPEGGKGGEAIPNLFAQRLCQENHDFYKACKIVQPLKIRLLRREDQRGCGAAYTYLK
jgi:hypothetical protein